MIYLGTLLISILSFFTTLYGLAIIVDFRLAVIGSLGLQLAMLGIAWNVMRIRQGRIVYVAVFALAAFFSIFFSYANFNTALKGKTRAVEARGEYHLAAQPVLAERLAWAQKAGLAGRYQVGRIGDLMAMERDKGGSVFIDEGSKDPVVQKIIDGARETVESWHAYKGEEYRQGRGRGIIYDYLESQRDHANANLAIIEGYINTVDSLSAALHNGLAVGEQYELTIKAAVRFPLAEVDLALGGNPQLIHFPPSPAEYPENAVNSQHALTMVINDLFNMDRLTFFSVILAIAIDAIVILMALAGSHVYHRFDYTFEKLEKDIARRTKKLPVGDEAADEDLAANIERYTKVNDYTRRLSEVILEHKKIKDEHIRRMRGKGERQPKEKRSLKIKPFVKPLGAPFRAIGQLPARLETARQDRIRGREIVREQARLEAQQLADEEAERRAKMEARRQAEFQARIKARTQGRTKLQKETSQKNGPANRFQPPTRRVSATNSSIESMSRKADVPV